MRTQRSDGAEAKLANAHARESASEAVIAHLKRQIAKLRREQYDASAERTRCLLEQMELQLEDLEADAAPSFRCQFRTFDPQIYGLLWIPI